MTKLEAENKRLQDELSRLSVRTVDDKGSYTRNYETEYEKFKTEYSKQFDRFEEEKRSLLLSIDSLKDQLLEAESTAKLRSNEIRTMKRELETTLNEFKEYKQKAESVLRIKEEIILSLKEGMSYEETSKIAETQKLHDEKELLRELEASEMSVRSLNVSLKQQEERLRMNEELASNEKKMLMKDLQLSLKSVNQYREQLERARIEYGFLQSELHRQTSDAERRLAEKDGQIEKLKAEMKHLSLEEKSAAMEEKVRDLSDKLIEKQTLIERLKEEKSVLTLKLENFEITRSSVPSTSSYSVDMNRVLATGAASALCPSFLAFKGSALNRIAGLVYRICDAVSLRLSTFMRDPNLRIFILVYCVLLHGWVAFVLLTYTPEIHPL
ncbi:hypothetical protein AB6A40_010136 [Gnathostoma spinigerum]|uniref:Golgin-84 n=1 Tax=Gnathostoma spinigerum TaxID=75299 RepID=A0ABD6EWD7_9BILA